MTNYSYIGSELELFARALNWKAYCSQLITRYLGSEVLEVGAGIGSTTKSLCKGEQKRWLCLEPDPVLVKQLMSTTTNSNFPPCCEGKLGTLANLSSEELFDSIIYMDVLEHIQDDRSEVKLATKHLKNNGFLIILSPAHQWLYTPFDEAIGHYRRYSKKNLSALMPDNLNCIRLMYLDSIGLLASSGNRFLLKSKMPTRQQIAVWDKMMVPLSRKVDPLLRYSLGKSILGIWQKRVEL